MKIICVDNFDRDNRPDQLIADNVLPHYAKYIAQCLNEKYSGEGSELFFKAVEDNYVLKEVDY